MRQSKVKIWEEFSINAAGIFSQRWRYPNLYLVRGGITFSKRPELLQVQYWELEAMLKGAIIKRDEYNSFTPNGCESAVNGFAELIENIKWNIHNLKDNNEWLRPLGLPH